MSEALHHLVIDGQLDPQTVPQTTYSQIEARADVSSPSLLF